jgi:hypothetical protein
MSSDIVNDEVKSYQDSSISKATGYRLDGRGAGIRFPTGTRDFSLFHSVQTGSEAHPAFYPMGTGAGLSLGVNQQGHEADRSLPSSASIKNGGALPPHPHTSSWLGTNPRTLLKVLHREGWRNIILSDSVNDT